MRIEIHSKRIDMDESLRAHIERRLGHAIGRFEEFIGHVTIHLAIGNGARGAPTKQCRICVSLKSAGDVEIEDSDVDLFSVTARAASRLGLLVFGELWRLRESRKRYSAGEE